jgi:hypothetical protein
VPEFIELTAEPLLRNANGKLLKALLRPHPGGGEGSLRRIQYVPG